MRLSALRWSDKKENLPVGRANGLSEEVWHATREKGWLCTFGLYLFASRSIFNEKKNVTRYNTVLEGMWRVEVHTYPLSREAYSPQLFVVVELTVVVDDDDEMTTTSECVCVCWLCVWGVGHSSSNDGERRSRCFYPPFLRRRYSSEMKEKILLLNPPLSEFHVSTHILSFIFSF